MSINRRSFLAGSAATGLSLALSSVFKTAAAAAPTPEQYSALCYRWGNIITGRNTIDPKNAAYTSALTALDKKVTATLAKLVRSPNRTKIFEDIDLEEEKSPAITKTPRAILALATGWATPGSMYFGQEAVLQDSIAALRDFLRLRYHPGQEEYGNWWDWESGASRAVGDLMCLLYDQLPAEVLSAAAAGINYFIPDPWFLRTAVAPGTGESQDAKPLASTGANRIDLCRAVICSAAATHDEERLRHALAGLAETWAIVTTGDGFYQDGSFIQHTHVPYTGSYGVVLIDGLSKLFTLISGSEFNLPAKQHQAVYRAVDKSFIPIIVDGQVLDYVRGRSVSRISENAAKHGKGVIRAILQLAQGAPAELAEHWKAVCKGWISRNHYDDLSKSNNIPEIALLADMLSSAQEAPALNLPIMFNSMDRLIHRSPKQWSIGIAMCSKRIAWYECGNGENNLGSRTGLGMRYLYLPTDMGQYEDGFWPTLNYAAPTGTTVDSYPLKPKAAGEWGKETPDNEWTGGIVQGSVSFVGMDLIGPDKDGLHARRVWLGTEEGMIEAVSDVHTDAPPALTVVEQRNLGQDGTNTLTVDGQKVTKAQTFTNPHWAHLEGTGGYIFLTPGNITGEIATHTGSWLAINPARKSPAAEKELQRNWATLHFSHAEHKTGAWYLVPNASLAKTQALANQLADDGKSDIQVLQNDAAAQIIRAGEYTGWAIWRAGTYAGWVFSQPAIALVHDAGDHWLLSVADPTQDAPQVVLRLPEKWHVEGEGVQATPKGKETELVFATTGREGQAIECRLTRA